MTKIVDHDVFENTLTNNPISKAERMVLNLKNFGKDNDPQGILQCIAFAAELEVIAKAIRKEYIEKKDAIIYALGGKPDAE